MQDLTEDERTPLPPEHCGVVNRLHSWLETILPVTGYHMRRFLADPVYIVGPELEQLARLKACDPPPPGKMVVMAWTAPEQMPYEDFVDWVQHQNDNHFGNLIIAYHPDDPALSELPDTEWLREQRVCVVRLTPMESYSAASEPQPAAVPGNYSTRQTIHEIRARAITPLLAQDFRGRDEQALSAYYNTRVN